MAMEPQGLRHPNLDGLKRVEVDVVVDHEFAPRRVAYPAFRSAPEASLFDPHDDIVSFEVVPEPNMRATPRVILETSKERSNSATIIDMPAVVAVEIAVMLLAAAEVASHPAAQATGGVAGVSADVARKCGVDKLRKYESLLRAGLNGRST